MTESVSPHALARRELNSSIRTLYEDTLVPVREIARVAGVTERNIYALVRRLDCRPRVRLTSGGGRRIVPFGTETPVLFDAEAVRHAVERCDSAVQDAGRIAASARADRDRKAAARQSRRENESRLRALELLGRALRDLAAIDKRREEKGRVRPKRRRTYEWRPHGVPPAWAERRGR